MYYYYQKAKAPSQNDPLAGKWVSCGGVRDYGTPAEIESSILFYLDYFSRTDTRGEQYSNGEYEVIIVRGMHGKVAGRDGEPFKESDIVRRRDPNANPAIAHYKLVYEGKVLGVRFRTHDGYFDIDKDTLRSLGLIGRSFTNLPSEELVLIGDKYVTKFEIAIPPLVVRDGNNHTQLHHLIRAKYSVKG
jgi:hypothetical protein